MATPSGGRIVTLTVAARDKLRALVDSRGLRGRAAVRITMLGRGRAGYEFDMTMDELGQPEPDDAIQEEGDFRIFVDAATLPALQGARVDFVDQLMQSGFQIEGPKPVFSDPLAADIQRLIEREVNPSVAGHGGYVELIDVKDNVVLLRLGGGCQGCAMVDVTLRQGIEVLIRRAFPQVVEVVDTTDHGGGDHPYYESAKGGNQASPFYQPAKG